MATAVQICCSLSAQLPDEYSYVAEAVASTKEPEPTVPHHYLASLYGGSGGIYVSLDETAAYREAELDAGRGNLMSLRPATEDEVAWHKSMGGRIQMVNPVPTAPANEAQSEVDHQVDFQYHRLGRD
ncbi:MAG: hypothetical protein GOVbin4933_31 [Prokaryotic dsDNA virus sp.]|nr:MAG: hypothetical protein GOVbin4933_31 [Prokaryotic dsDNA virus sp.]